MHYVYVLERNEGDLYIGYTNDLRRRFKEHKKKYECALVYYECCTSSKQAREREHNLKHYGSAWRALKKRISA